MNTYNTSYKTVKSRSEQPSHDDIIISITNTTTKVKLICPVSITVIIIIVFKNVII